MDFIFHNLAVSIIERDLSVKVAMPLPPVSRWRSYKLIHQALKLKEETIHRVQKQAVCMFLML